MNGNEDGPPERSSPVLLVRLADWALRFSPVVEPVEPDTILLDITGCERLFGGEEAIACQALAGLRARRIRARAAIADTVGAAHALAIYGGFTRRVEGSCSANIDRPPFQGGLQEGEQCWEGSRSTLPQPLPAREGGNDRPPSQGGPQGGKGAGACSCENSVVVAAVGDIHAPLAPLPTAALRIEPAVVERLDALGVRAIGDLLALPRSTLPARFGRQLVRRLQQALGEVYEGVTPHRSNPPPTTQESFETPLRDFGTLLIVVGRLLDDLFAQLVKQSRALHRVDCTLVYENTPPSILKINLSRASQAWKHIAELVRRRLEAVGLADGLLGVRVTAAETSRFEPGQIDLFEPTDPNDEEQLGCLIDRLINRLGADAVVCAELADDYQPERTFVYRPPSQGGPQGGRAKRPRSTLPQPLPVREGRSVCPRPVHLLPTPLEVRVIALVPDGPPSWVVIREREYVIARAWGPERIETGWWRGPDVCRDYFRALAETGEQFWIFRRRTDGRWYLHGRFI